MSDGLVHRYLDPEDSLAEVLFGLIMALTFTLGARLLTQANEIHPRELVAALVGCNLAWGVIDGVLYLLGILIYRNRRILFVRRLKKAADDRQALDAIREEFDLEDEPAVPDADRAILHRTMLEILRHARTERVHLRRQDVAAALLIAGLVTATAIPGVLPFLVLDDRSFALRVANAVQICLLFAVGFRWARHTGANPWWTGLVMVLLGLALVGICLALGG
jgi:hypothetical protein